MVVKRVGPLSVAKNAALLYAMLGLVIGAMFSLAAMAGAFSGFAGEEGVGLAAGMAGLFGVGAIVVAPIMYACFGFVGALIMSVLYNIVASMVGGIELEVE